MSHDTIIHRFVRPAVRVVAKTPVTPDHLTALRFVTAVVAAAAFARGGQHWVWIGAAVFLLSAFLDRADGELARQTKRFSQHGHRYDLIADWSAGAMTFVGLGIGAREGWLGAAAPVLGALAAAGVSVLFWAINVREVAPLPRFAADNGRVLMDPDDAMFALPPLLWCFGASAVLLPAGVLTPLLAIWMVLCMRSTSAAPATAELNPIDAEDLRPSDLAP
jgi:archaetidylinositol phosphate synthase